MSEDKKERFLNCVIDNIYKKSFAFCSKNVRIKTKTFWQNFAQKDVDKLVKQNEKKIEKCQI